MKWTLAIILVAIAAALGLAACGGDDEDGQASAEEELCGSLASFSSAVVNLQGLSPESTKDDIAGARDDVASALEDVKSDAEDVASADTEALENAHDDLSSAVDDLPGETTAAQGLEELKPQLNALAGTYREMYNGAGCQN